MKIEIGNPFKKKKDPRQQKREIDAQITTLERENRRLGRQLDEAERDAGDKVGTEYYEPALDRCEKLNTAIEQKRQAIQTLLFVRNQIDAGLLTAQQVKTIEGFKDLVEEGAFSFDVASLQQRIAESGEKMEQFEDSIQAVNDMLAKSGVRKTPGRENYKDLLRAKISAGTSATVQESHIETKEELA